MSRAKEIITELDDYELAYFARFKLKTYRPKTQLEIKKYIADKGLTENRIDKLIATNPKRETKNGEIRCQRCSSNKIRREKIERPEAEFRLGTADENNSLKGLNNKASYGY